MVDYVKNLSAFRLLLLFLFAVAGGIFLYGHIHETEEKLSDRAGRERLMAALFEAAENFGSHLVAQEALGGALALQYEMLSPPIGDTEMNGILESALAKSPDYVQGVGIVFPGSEKEAQHVAFLTRDRRQDNFELGLAQFELDESRPLTAREINMKRRMYWTLLSTPPTNGVFRFGSMLTLSLGGEDTPHAGGNVIIRSDLGWLAELFRKLAGAGAGVSFCVTPDREILWLENNRLYFDKDYEPGENRIEETIRKVKKYVESGSTSNEFNKADILGTGWCLLVAGPTPTSPPPGHGTLSVSLFVMLAVGGVLLADAFLATKRGRSRGTEYSVRTRIVSPRETAMRPKKQGVFDMVYSLLFKYRMIDPYQERIDSELRVARQIQFSLVPDSFPSYSEWREFDLYSLLEPAKEVGGDYYDFFMLDSDKMLLAVGDVSGKGVPAALYMAVCRTAFRTLARETNDPGELLSRLNDMLVRDNQAGLYITIVTFIIDLPSGECTYSIAGHPAPLWHESRTGLSNYIEDPRETFIGLKAGLSFPVGTLRLAPGDTLLLYTDGVTEARDPEGNDLYFSGLKERFAACVRAPRCQSVIEELEASLREYMGHKEQLDDITLLAFRYWGPGGQKIIRKRERESARLFTNAT